jgi:hypothetical protein
MQRRRFKLREFVFEMALLMLTLLMWGQFGWVGLLIALGVAAVVAIAWPIAKAKWERRGSLR